MHGAEAVLHVVNPAVGGLDDARVVLKAVDGVVDIALGLPQGLAVIQGVGQGQLGPAGVHLGGDFEEQVAAEGGGGAPPGSGFVKGPLGSRHGQLHVRRAALRHDGDDRLVGGICDLPGFARQGGHPLAVDVIEPCLHAGFLPFIHICSPGPRPKGKEAYLPGTDKPLRFLRYRLNSALVSARAASIRSSTCPIWASVITAAGSKRMHLALTRVPAVSTPRANMPLAML
ncbi:hypothetical protein SDC9_171340 [bioreactor metagenome]|uniref:Uncharacterized protein n=1 Tax=bioreactor metagenome TaxID=1076179 RepID=A0A645GAK4_9ZZZZ